MCIRDSPNQAAAMGMIARSGLSVEDAARSFPFNGGGYNVPGMFGGSGGIGWGLGGMGSPPGYVGEPSPATTILLICPAVAR